MLLGLTVKLEKEHLELFTKQIGEALQLQVGGLVDLLTSTVKQLTAKMSRTQEVQFEREIALMK